MCDMPEACQQCVKRTSNVTAGHITFIGNPTALLEAFQPH
jgi:hypothetical protein